MRRAETAVALVTGANKGIGLEVARQLGQAGFCVLVAARDFGRGSEAAAMLTSEGLNARFEQLDVTDDPSVAAMARRISVNPGRLDVLVNNAGVLFEGDFNGSDGPENAILPLPSEIDVEIVRRTYATNVFAAIAVTNALLPLLRRSPAARIVNVSSSLASSSRANRVCSQTDRHPYLNLLAYNSSKAALNHATLQYAIELRSTGIKVNAADPGHCATDINGHLGNRHASEAAKVIVQLATLPKDGPTGSFLGDDGPRDW